MTIVVVGLIAVLSGCPNLFGGQNGNDEESFTVTYDANGAESGTAPEAQTKSEGVDVTLAGNTGNLARTGYTFAGWNTADDGSGTDYAEGATYTADADVTLYAKWTQLPTYTVAYDANGAESGTPPVDQTKTEGVDLTLANNTGTLARTGFDFDGWNSADDGSGTDYAEGATYSDDADVTLYAKWTVATYTITYNDNSADSGSAPANQTKTHGTDLTLASNSGGLGITGYQTFAGWNTASDGSGTSYAEDATYSADADLTLYAQWSAIGETGEAGGVIFYDDEADGTDDIDGARYLEAAPIDIDVSGDYTHPWGDYGTEIGGDAQLTGIGEGQAATDAIVAHMDAESITGTTAQLADEFSHNGYIDWYLPSKDELDLMYTNRVVIGGFDSFYYWSSSESSNSQAWHQIFGTSQSGDQSTGEKASGLRVRAVRAF